MSLPMMSAGKLPPKLETREDKTDLVNQRWLSRLLVLMSHESIHFDVAVESRYGSESQLFIIHPSCPQFLLQWTRANLRNLFIHTKT